MNRPWPRWLSPFLFRAAAWRSASSSHLARRQGVRWLAHAPSEGALGLLTRALADPHPLVRAAAAETLALHGAREAARPILAAIEEGLGNAYLQATLWESLGRIAGEEIPFDPVEEENETRRRIAEWRRKLVVRDA